MLVRDEGDFVVQYHFSREFADLDRRFSGSTELILNRKSVDDRRCWFTAANRCSLDAPLPQGLQTLSLVTLPVSFDNLRLNEKCVAIQTERSVQLSEQRGSTFRR